MKSLQLGTKSSKLEGYLRICKNKCHPLDRYSYPGEGAIVKRSIANYIIIEGGCWRRMG